MIETERLRLRAFTRDDAKDLYEYLSMPTVNCFMDMKVEDMEQAGREAASRSEAGEYYFAVELKSEQKVIGEVFAFPEGEGSDTFSPCWMLNPAYQGKGYAHEAVHALFDYLFSEKNARRLYAYTEDDNLPSQRLCERLGMRQEGLFLEFISFVKNPDGTPKYENTIQYAILNWEWRKIAAVMCIWSGHKMVKEHKEL